MVQEISTTAVSQLQWGHWLMALCAFFYLAWWIIFFRPHAGKVQGALYGIGAGCLVIAALAGIAGAALITLGANGLVVQASPVGWLFLLGALVAYGLLAWATSHFMSRPITTELVLLVAWATIELYTAYALCNVGALGFLSMVWLVAVIVLIFAVSLVCYLLYYRLTALPSFIDGALPLALVGIFSVVLPLVLKL